METHQIYLAGEIVEDVVAGSLTRREALRRLGMMGFTVTGATVLLAACGGGDDDDVTSQPATGAPTSGPAGAVATEAVTYPGRTATLMGAWAGAASAKGAVLVIHENRGLNDHIRSVAARLAGDGYSALAVDLLSEEGGSAKVGQADAATALGAAGTRRLVDDLRSSLDDLARRQPGARLGVVGFCFGGTMAWTLLASGEARLAAAAPFYGSVSPTVDLSGARAAVLGIYAERDPRVNATRESAASALEKARLTHEMRTFPGVSHAFFNDTGQNYDAVQATAAYRAVLDWFGRHLAR